MGPITITIVPYGTPKYEEVWDLREEILRKPLGLSLKNDDMSRDLVDKIFAAEHDGQVIGCVLLNHHNDENAQLRAMAVYDEWQGKGVGRLLVEAAERYAVSYGYKRLELHARKVALGFYKGMGYKIYGDEFTEVGIPHYMMEKSIS